MPSRVLQGWLAGEEVNRGRERAGMQNAAGAVGILGALQQQAMQRQAAEQQGLLKQALATGDIDTVAKIDPRAAATLSQLLDAKRQQQFFAPENVAKYSTPGRPEYALPEDVAGPVQAAEPAQVNLPAFAQAGVMRGVPGMEPLLNHLTAAQLRQAQLEQMASDKQAGRDQRTDEAAWRSQEAERARQEQHANRLALLQAAQAGRAPPAPQPLEAVIGTDGKPVLVPRNEAIGRTPATRNVQTPRALPVQALRLQQEALDAIGTSRGINADMSSISQQIDTGKLNLGLVQNVGGEIRNRLGVSNEQSRNLASFKATLEKMRNDSLRLNKGVQTEGDSVRAWNELVKNINDPEVVKQRLTEIQLINQRAAELRTQDVNVIRENFGQPPIDLAPYQNQPPAVGANRGRIQRPNSTTPAQPTPPAGAAPAQSILDQADAILGGGR